MCVQEAEREEKNCSHISHCFNFIEMIAHFNAVAVCVAIVSINSEQLKMERFQTCATINCDKYNDSMGRVINSGIQFQAIVYVMSR